MTSPHPLSRREFLLSASAALVTARLGAATDRAAPAAVAEPIIDIHQHTNYGGLRDAAYRQIGPARTHAQLRAHQLSMGVTTTILLPAGRELFGSSTIKGRANGLEGTVSANEDNLALARAYPHEFAFGANEVPDLPDAPAVIEKYLKLGAILIGEQKFGVECDSAAMQKLYQLAEAYRVPILMHWQVGSYNQGFDRFHTMLKKYPNVNFIGHAQTWWANIDKAGHRLKAQRGRMFAKLRWTSGFTLTVERPKIALPAPTKIQFFAGAAVIDRNMNPDIDQAAVVRCIGCPSTIPREAA